MKAPIIAILVLIFILQGCDSPDSTVYDLDLSAQIQAVPSSGIYRDSIYFHWGGSIIKGGDGKYHLFYSRWKRDFTFAGWLTFSEIAHATATEPTGPWQFRETVLEGRGSGHWDAITAHNPKIKYFEGKYYLYYISTNFSDLPYNDSLLIGTHGRSLEDDHRRLLRENQRTGVAVAKTLDGPWQRLNHPIVEPDGPIVTLTVNPAITQGPDQNYFLIVKGDKPNETAFIRNQALAVGSSPIGPFEIQNKPVISNLDTEDASLWYDVVHRRFYSIFHAHTFIGLMESRNGRSWSKAMNYKIMEKKIDLADGSMLHPDRMERPFVFSENETPKILCLAVKKGDDAYTVFVPLAAD